MPDQTTTPEDQAAEPVETAVRSAVDAMAAMPPRVAYALATRLRGLFEDQRKVHLLRIREDEELYLAESLGRPRRLDTETPG